MRFSSENALNQWVREAERLWLFLDYDGTLKQFTRTPEMLEPDQDLIDLVEQLAQKSNIRLAILTGRRLQDIQTLLPINRIFFAATYGIELQTPQGEHIQRVEFDRIRPFLAQLKTSWEKIITDHQHFYLEDKGWALAIHARFAPTKESDEVFSIIKRTLGQNWNRDDFQLIVDKKFLELSPTMANKAKTVSFLLNHFPFPKSAPLYIGDDANDAQAFKIVHSSGGVAIAVAQYFGRVRASGADLVMKSPRAVREWLKNLVSWF